ncbi:MAG: hypothetical protein ACE5IH_02580 [Thermodesulfobacteriota bacterium]
MVFKHIIKDERGIALVIAMIFSLVIFAAAITFTYRLSSFIRTTKASQVKSQSIYTTDTGVEMLRHYFWWRSCAPPNWCDGDNKLSNTVYVDFTSDVLSKVNTGILPNNQTVPPLSVGYNYEVEVEYTNSGNVNITHKKTDDSKITTTAYDYDIYLKRTPTIQNTIEVLASSEQSDQEAMANTSAAIIFTVPCSEDYKQFGQCVGKEGSSGEKVGTLALRGPF